MRPKNRPGSRSSGAEEATLRLFRREPACRVLGPGCRAVLWVQGCSRACPGCLVPESWSPQGPESCLEEVAGWVQDCPGIEGITLTGGEPMEQARALACLVDRIRSRRDLGVVCFTGYRLEELRHEDHLALLARVDLLIEGPYRVEQHSDLLWRGSSNQRLLPLTPRYLAFMPEPDGDRGAGLEFRFEPDGAYAFAGVPPWPNLREALPEGRPR